MKKLLTFLILNSAFLISFAQWTQTSYPELSPSCIANNGTAIYVGDSIGKVFSSADGGGSWTDVSIGLPSTNWITCLTIYDTIVFAGTKDSGMYMSNDDGLIWNQVTGGIPTVGGIISMAVNGTTIYAVTELHFYFSTDGGTSWTMATGPFFGTPTAIVTNGYNVLLSTTYFAGGAIFISSNNGTNWTFVAGDDYYSMVSSDTIVLAGTRGSSYGVHRSFDGGNNWQYYNPSFPNNSTLHTLAVAISGSYYFAGTSGTGIYFSTNNGSSWTNDNAGISYPSPFVQCLNAMDTMLFAGMQGGLWMRGLANFQPYATAFQTNAGCNGDSTGSIAATAVGGTAPFLYSIDGGTTYYLSNVFTGLSEGSYSIVIKDANTHYSDTLSVNITEPNTLTVSNSSIINADCSVNNGSISATVSGGTSPYSYLWNNGDTTLTSQNIIAGEYYCTVTDVNGCTAVSSTDTIVTNLLNNTPICMVTVDSLSTHNIIVWEKSLLPSSIDSFRIYRETMTNIYTFIGAVSNDSLSEYHDYASNPNSTSFKYKLRATTVCGDTTYGLSDFHNTIHLQYLGFGNLLWSLYDIESSGNPVTYYIVLRDDTNTGNFQPISSTIPGTNSSYTDVNYLSYPNARYRADVAWSIACNPTRVLTTTRSNIIQNNTSVGVNELGVGSVELEIYPNPTIGELRIKNAELRIETVKITNLLGKCVLQQQLSTTNYQLTLDVSSLPSGIYFIQINNSINKKFVKYGN